jgi:nucleotide sugar dehydrogenase
MNSDRVISVIGLGYVGLPVAVAFGKVGRTVGFDINRTRIKELQSGYDRTGEVTTADLQAADILFTEKLEELAQADFHIVAIPAPVDEEHQPDLTPMYKASETVGRALKKGDIVVYESTVYPGVTEDECEPVNRDFRKGDVLHSQADISKAATLFGYEPSHTIAAGLDTSLSWYIANLDASKTADIHDQ